MGELLSLAIVVATLLVTFLAGRAIERSHFADIERREREHGSIAVTNARVLPDGYDAASSTLCTGSVVVGTDYFRRFAAALKTIIGGRLGGMDRFLARGRREAVQRMLAQARAAGADLVLNVRLETAAIGRGTGAQPSMAVVEVVAYGTAVRRRA